MEINTILNADSYKEGHFKMYPPKTQYVRSYIEARSDYMYEDIVFFGLQGFLKEYLCKPVTEAMLSEAAEILDLHGPRWNRAGWEYIIDEHDGYLPLEIKAPLEGTILRAGNVMTQVINTDPECYWLTSYIETALLRAVWAPTTVASLSRAIKQDIKKYLGITGCADVDTEVQFKLHDFGFRGTSSYESGAILGSAHLVNFLGTDTLGALKYIKDYYNNPCAGFSVNASEHSPIIAWGKENERAAYQNILDQFLTKDSIVACVSDSYDIMAALDMWGEMEDQIKNSGGTLVVRPDSGDPVEMSCKVISRLMEIFGYSFTETGYTVLPPYIRVIYGDGINRKVIRDILYSLYRKGIAAENIAFGMGGALLQSSTRDDLSFAMKANQICVDGEWRNICKTPTTDSGKESKSGEQALVKLNGIFHSYPKKALGKSDKDYLEVVYLDGKLIREQSFDEIRSIANGV